MNLSSNPFRVLLIPLSLFLVSCAPEIKAPPPPVRPAKIAVVLGAGASKGFAHIGVLKILEMNKTPVHMIVGTSAGSFVGSLYSYGYSGVQLQKIAMTIEKGDIADLIFPDNGFIQGLKIQEYVNKMVKDTPIDKLKIPFYAVATDVQNGKEVIFGKGDTGTAVRASCSIPGVFRPVKIQSRMYVDGGVVSPVAVDAARKYGADIVIAVDITADSENPQPQSTIDTLLQSINIMYSKLAIVQLSKADVVIRPNVGHIGAGDFERRHDAILEGEKAAMDALPAINAIIERLKKEGRL
jgi:NTE family protein